MFNVILLYIIRIIVHDNSISILSTIKLYKIIIQNNTLFMTYILVIMTSIDMYRYMLNRLYI